LEEAGLGFPAKRARDAAVHRARPGRAAGHYAASLGITERSVNATVTDLTVAGYLVQQKDGRRNGWFLV
jgi:hypothetical protein